MLICPVCDTKVDDAPFKLHLEAHTFELMQRLKNPDDAVIKSIRATGLKPKIVGGLIKDLIIEGEIWK